MKFIIGISIALILGILAFKPLFKTRLRVSIYNELGNIEEGVKVTLYRSMEDYRDGLNSAFPSQNTDAKGKTTFKNIEPIVYYISAEKGDKNNVGKGVTSDAFKAGKMNKITIIIE